MSTESENYSKLNESFKDTHHKIINEIGTVLAYLNADSGIMSNIMSWGDTLESKETLKNLIDYNLKFINSNKKSECQ